MLIANFVTSCDFCDFTRCTLEKLGRGFCVRSDFFRFGFDLVGNIYRYIYIGSFVWESWVQGKGQKVRVLQ